MQLRALTHLVEVATALSQCERVVILGSSSLLPQFPELGEDAGPLTLTFDADFLIEPGGPRMAEVLVEAIGANSLFESANGYHADILRPEIASTLPPGWEQRLIPLVGFSRVFSLDLYDLAAVKLVVGRAKDLDLVRVLLRLGHLEAIKLRERFQTLPLGERELFSTGKNLAEVLKNGRGA